MAPPKGTTQISPGIYEIPKTYKEGMLVPARIFASPELMNLMDEGVYDQITNVACLPGIVEAALCMPDGHWGYGFPIGGVAAFDGSAAVGASEFQNTQSNRFIADINAELGEEVFNIPIAHRETEIEPDGLANNVRVKAVTAV